MSISRTALATGATWLLAAVALSATPATAQAELAPESGCAQAMAAGTHGHHMHGMEMHHMHHMHHGHRMQAMGMAHEPAPGMHDTHGMDMHDMHGIGMHGVDPEGMANEMGMPGEMHAGSCSSADPVAPRCGMGVPEVGPGASPLPGPEEHRAHHGSPAPGDAGQPVPAAAADGVVVAVTLTDALRIEPESMSVPAGVPVTFVVTNAGALPHEFVVGDEAAQEAHESAMRGTGSMTHDEPTAVGLQPGESRELTITFDEPGETLAGCHLPGHYAAGMKATIVVTTQAQDQP